MKLQFPRAVILGGTHYAEAVSLISSAAMLCYNVQEMKGETQEEIFANRENFIRRRMHAGHESVIEHAMVTCLFEVDRGVTHEMVRHRLCSFTQSSTRYCDYTGEKYDGNVSCIIPPWVGCYQPGEYQHYGQDNQGPHIRYNGERIENYLALPEDDRLFLEGLLSAENYYKLLRQQGWAPEMARGMLAHFTVANIMWSANLREWRHILNLRAVGMTGRPHPQMEEVMIPLLYQFKATYPVFFEDINLKEHGDKRMPYNTREI